MQAGRICPDILDLDRKREIGDRKSTDGSLKLTKAVGRLSNGSDIRLLAPNPLPANLWINLGRYVSFADLTMLSQVSRFFRWIKSREVRRRCDQDHAKVTKWVLKNLPAWRKEERLSDSRTPNWSVVYQVSRVLRTTTAGDLIIKTPTIYLGVLPNGKLIGTGNGCISVIDPINKRISREPTHLNDGFGSKPLFLDDGSTIAALDKSHRSIILYGRGQGGYYVRDLLQTQAKMGCFGSLAQNRLIAVCGRSIHIWDIRPVCKVQDITNLSWQQNASPTAVATWHSRYAAIALDVPTSKGGLLTRQVIILDLETQETCFSFDVLLHGMVESLVFLNGHLLALGHFDGTIIVLDLKNPKVTGTRRHHSRVASLTVLPNGTLVSGGWGAAGEGLVCVHRRLRLRQAALTTGCWRLA